MDIPPPLLHAGAALFGVDPTGLRRLGGMDGVAYAYERGGAQYVLKLAPAQAAGLPTMRAKLDFVNHLSANGVRVARPVPSARGELLETLDDTPGEAGDTGPAGATGRLWAVTAAERAPGKHAYEAGEFGDELYALWGRTVGQMHRLTKDYDQARAKPAGLIQDWEAEMQSFAQWCDDDAVRQKWLALRDTLRGWTPGRDCYGLIHNDLHPMNFMVCRVGGELRLTVFDFDVCAYHWFMTDLGIAVFHLVWGRWGDAAYTRSYVPRFLDHFLRGYCLENSLDDAWLKRLPLFVKYRQMLLHTVFSHEWSHPTPEQAAILSAWRRAIVEDQPAIDF